MTKPTTSEARKNWYFQRSRMRAQRRWHENFLRRRGKRKAEQRALMMEALEPRVLFSAAPVTSAPGDTAPDGPGTADAQVTIDTFQPQTHPSEVVTGPGTQEEMIGETFNFEVGFENVGSQTGYGPYVDVVTPGGVELVPDPVTGETANMSGIDISNNVICGGHVVEYNAASSADYAAAVGGIIPASPGPPAVPSAPTSPLGNAWDAIDQHFRDNGLTSMNIWVACPTDPVTGAANPAADVTSTTFDFTNPPPLASGIVPVGVGPVTYPGQMIEHPMLDHFAAGIDANGLADGETFYTVELPYGSYVPGISPKEITFAATLNPGDGNQDTDTDHYVEVDEPVSVRASGGFRYGATPGGTDDAALIDGGCVSGDITARIVELKKDVELDDHEKVSGPNNPWIFSLDVDIAKDQTLTNLIITDDIPDELIYVPNSVVITFPNGAMVTAPVSVTQPHDTTDNYYAGNTFIANEDPNPPGGQLIIDFSEIIASSDEDDFGLFTDGTVFQGSGSETDGFWDIHITYEAYAAEFDANGDPVMQADPNTNPPPHPTGLGDDLDDPGNTAINEAGVVADFLIDPDNDGDGVDSGSATDDDNTIDGPTSPNGSTDPGEPVDADIVSVEIDPMTIDKDIVNTYKADGSPGNGQLDMVPGDLIEYSLEIDVSDFFGFADLQIEDYIEDGLQMVDLAFFNDPVNGFNGVNPAGLDLSPMIAMCYHGPSGPQTVGFDANGDWDGTGSGGFWPTLTQSNILPNDPNAPHLGSGADVTDQTANFSGGDLYEFNMASLVGHADFPGFTGDLFGPLFDPANTTNGDPFNGANPGGNPAGYYWFYDQQTVDANGVPTGLNALNEDVGKGTKIEIRFFAQVMDNYEFTETGVDTGVDITDELWNYSFVEGTLIEDGIDSNGDGLIDTPDQDGDGVADDLDGDYDPSQEERYRDEGREEVEIQAPTLDKNLVALSGDSILDNTGTFVTGGGAGSGDEVNNLNGSAGADGNIDNPTIQVGECITYRLTAEMPFGSGEEIRITDFLPLPAFDLNDYLDVVTDNGATVPNSWGGTDASIPLSALGGNITWNYGPDHNIPTTVVQDSYGTVPTGNTASATNPTGVPPGTAGLVEPVVSFNLAQNSIVWNFGTWTNGNDNDPTNDSTTIDILFTICANADPFVDDLNLTNEGLLTVNDTDVEATDEIGIVQVNLAAPELQMVKGVLGVSSQSNNQGNGQWDGVFGNFDEFGDNGGGGHFGQQNQSPMDAWFGWGHPNHDTSDPTTTPAANPFGMANTGNGAWDGGSAITSDVLHDTGTDGITTQGEQDAWHRAFNSDMRDIDAGDILTFGIVVENVGAGSAHDIVIGDQIIDGEVDNPNRNFGVTSFDSSDYELVGGTSTAGLTDPQMIDELNFRVFLGDGTELFYGVDYDVTFTPAGPQFFSLELFDAGNTHLAADGAVTNNSNAMGGLAKGRVNGDSSDYADNATGQNILFIKYDVEVKNTWELQDRHTNEAILEGYSGYHGGGVVEGGMDDYLDADEDGVVTKKTYIDDGNGRFNSSSTDHEAVYEDAETRGRSPRINKGFLTTDRPETGDGSTTGDQHNTEDTWTNGSGSGGNQERINSGYDATIGEEVIYGLMIHVPEGTAENFRVQDFLPAGLEFVDARIITNAADIGTASYLHAGAVPAGYSPYTAADAHAMSDNVNNNSGIPQWRETPFMMGPAGSFDAAYQYGGATPVFTGTQPQPGDTGTLTFNFGDLLNAPSGGPFNDATPGVRDSNQIDGRQDDTFMIEIRTRVTNDINTSPYANDNGGVDPNSTAATGTDLNTAAETANSDGDVRNNDARIRADQWFEDQWAGNQGDLNENSFTEVDIDIVEPELNISKDIVTVSHLEGNIDPNTGLPYVTNYANLGELVTYEIVIEHDGSSTAPAFNINFHDVIFEDLGVTGLPLTDATIQNIRIEESPANIMGGVTPGTPVDIVLAQAMATTPAVGDGVHYQRVAGQNNTEQGTGFTFNSANFLTDITMNNTINLNFDYLEVGDRIVLQYDVLIDANNASAIVNNYNVNNDDLHNEATMTYYSVPEASPLPTTTGTNPEPREKVEVVTEDLALIIADLTVEKNDGVQIRQPAELYSYTLTGENKAVHDHPLLLGEPVAEAHNVIITDTLPPELNFQSITGYTAAANPLAPVPGEYVVTILPGGFTQIEIYILGPASDGTLDPGESEAITLNVQVDPTLPSGDYTIENHVDIKHDFGDPTPEDNEDKDIDEMSVRPDLFITKNDGVQLREAGETYDYTLAFGAHEFQNDGVTPAGSATNVIITDILPPELVYNSTTVTINGVPYPVTPILTPLPDGSTKVEINVGTLQPGDVGELVMNVTVNPDLPAGVYEINNTVEIGGDEPEFNYDDNEDFDIDELTIVEDGFFGGSGVLQGFRLLDDDSFFNKEDEDEDMLPILTLMPIYSGTADPGTVLRIKVMGDTGAPLTNGDQTIVADAGGNWLATFPGLVLHEEPHMVVIEQTAPSWNTGNQEHGYNLRTYFAPAISPTHAQMEAMNVGDVLARRLNDTAIDSMATHDGDHASHENTDWRLANYETYCLSGIGGILR